MTNFFRTITSRRGIGLLIPATTVVVAVMVHGDREENDVRDTSTKIYSSARSSSSSSWMYHLKSPIYYDYNNTNHSSSKTYCDAATAAAVSRTPPKLVVTEKDNHTTTPIQIRPGGQMLQQQPSTGVHGENEQKEQEEEQKEEEVYYHNLFPLRQLFVPALEYPLWDENWDERQSHPPNTSIDGNDDTEQQQQQQQQQQHKNYIRQLRKNGVTRHIILVRHGQYDETHKEDETRILTPLGRDQAHMTGKRIAEMIQGAEETFGSPCHVKALRVSNLTRAKETAAIIASYLPSTVAVIDPDPMLNEGRPCHTIPGGRMSFKDIETTDHHHPRIEGAFRKYIHRAPEPSSIEPLPESKHEFEIIVCHANVIRYIMCRALQLPPEAWLRFCPFNCSLTYLTIRPTGTVSCRMIGDIGHLPYSASTFSGHHGYNW